MINFSINFPYKELNVIECAQELHMKNPLFMIRASDHGLFIPHKTKKNGMLNARTTQYIQNIIAFPNFSDKLHICCIEDNMPRYGWKLIKDHSNITMSNYLSLPSAYKHSNLYTRMQVVTPDGNIIYVDADCIIDMLLNYPGIINKDTLEIDDKLFYNHEDKTLKREKEFAW